MGKCKPMKIYIANRCAAGILATSIISAGCAGSTGSFAAPRASQSERAARPACTEARSAQAHCLVLIEPGAFGSTVSGWTPADFQARYNLPSSTKGSGQIVAIVDAYDNPNVASDLAAYRSQFGLGTANFYKYNQEGEQGHYPSGSAGWGIESDLDSEMVSASCPLCTIYLVEANTANGSDLESAEAEAVALGAHIVTNSWTCSSSNCVGKSYFDSPGVEYLASDGDGGSGQLDAPSELESVAAIGGTVLSKNGSQYSETVWNDSGGCATGIKKPKWQHDTICNGRAVGDASAVAVGVAEYDSYGAGGWLTVDGTSIPAPLLAGVFGLAGNATKQDGGRTFWMRKHRKALYDVCGSSCLFSQYSYGGGWGSPDGIGAF
jgi:subtilase family serine protease